MFYAPPVSKKEFRFTSEIPTRVGLPENTVCSPVQQLSEVQEKLHAADKAAAPWKYSVSSVEACAVALT